MRRETDGRELVDAVLAFARELNALQREYASRMPRFRREGRMEALLSAYRAEAEALCRRRLTERKRCKALPQRPAFAALEGARSAEPEKAKKYAQVLLNQAKLIAGLPIGDPSGYTDLLCSLWT